MSMERTVFYKLVPAWLTDYRQALDSSSIDEIKFTPKECLLQSKSSGNDISFYQEMQMHSLCSQLLMTILFD